MGEIKRVEFECYNRTIVALFDDGTIKEPQVKKAIKLYPDGHDERIAFMTKEQFRTVFKALLGGDA